MTDNALEVAHHPGAPADERADAMRVAQSSTAPSSVPDMLPLVQYVAEQYQEQQMFKSLQRPGLAPNPSLAAKRGTPGMQSVWLDEQRIQFMGDWYEKPGAFTFDNMRLMADRTPVLSAVLLTRIRQVKRFCRVQEGGEGPGFAIKLKDGQAHQGDRERESIKLLESFFTNCGWETNPRQRMRLRRDNFAGLMAKLTRDTLTLDSAPIETEWKRDKRLGLDGLYAVDGASIRLCSEVGYEGEDEVFALQVVDSQVRTAYTYDDLIYVPRNPRTDIMAGGYGQSETELLVKVVTGFLNAMTYNLKYFDSNAIPKGLLHLSGDYSQDDISNFKRYWNSMVKGINNSWTLPVMVSKNQESRASFENFGVDVNEIMFAKWMTFLTSIICAIYGIAPDEINFESFTAGTSSLSGSDTEEKLVNSKDKGLRPLLSHFEDLFSDYIVSEFGDKYCFRWTGLDEDTPEVRWDKAQKLMTWGEARSAFMNLDSVGGDLDDVPLNPVLQGPYQQAQQAAGEDYGDPDGMPPGAGVQGEEPGQDGDEPEGGEGGPEEDAEGEDGAEAGEEMQKSFGLPVFRVDP